MSDAWQSIQIQEFEHLPAGPSTALLRVTAKPARRRASAGRRPVLAADDGRSVHRFVAIPAPPDGRGVLRAAYSVPAELLQTQTGFSLEIGKDRSVPLPAPVPAARLPAVSATSAASPPAAGRAAAETEIARAREKSEAVLAELQTWQGELERRLAATTTELAAAKSARQGDQRQIERLRGELAASEAQVQLAQSELQRRGEGAPETGDAALAEARTEIQMLRARLERAHAANESDQLELIRLSAEADARVEAERELTRAVQPRSER